MAQLNVLKICKNLIQHDTNLIAKLQFIKHKTLCNIMNLNLWLFLDSIISTVYILIQSSLSEMSATLHRPQLVMLTFDDSVNDLNRDLYSEIFKDYRLNPNGCPISATFFVSHEWTDYSQVQNLYASGHEIASHSIS